MRNLLLAVFVVVLLGVHSTGWAAPVTKRQDGLVATVNAESQSARASWRFEAPLPAPLERFGATFNGRTVPIAAATSYPQDGDRTALLLLVDVTGGEQRTKAIYRAKGRLLRIYDSIRPHHVVALGVVDDQVRLAVIDDGRPDPLGAMLAGTFSDAQPQLGETLAFAQSALSKIPAARRAAFIFTDGFSQTRIDAQGIIDAAKASGVALNILLERSGRPGDYASLQRIAEETGGVYAEGDAIRAFAETPFSFVDSGAYADIDLTGLFVYPWDDNKNLTVSFSYGGKTLDLVAPVEARPATAQESVRYLWQNFGLEVAVMGAAAGWAIAFVGMAVGGTYRRRVRLARQAAREAAASAEQPVDIPADGVATGEEPAVAQAETAEEQASASGLPDGLTESAMEQAVPPHARRLSLRLFRSDGASFVDVPLDGDRIAIGRGDDNDIVLKEATVSTRQALLVADARGGYSLQNLSETNPTSLNGAPLVEHELAGGELVDLGGVRGEFIVVPGDDAAAPIAGPLPSG